MSERLVNVEVVEGGHIDLVVSGGVDRPGHIRIRMTPSDCTQLIMRLTATLGATAQTAVDELGKWVNTG